MILEANLKKSTLALSALTLALAAGLSACGGGTSTYTIGGIVAGLEYPGLVLSNNGEDLPITAAGYDEVKDAAGNVIGRAPKNVDYRFRNEVDYGAPYDVTIKAQPLHQECERRGGTTDTAGRLSVINAVVVCSLVSNTIGGTISGLTAEGLELTNGSTGGTLTAAKDATGFTFTNPVTYGQTYGVTVLKQPTGLTCSVANGAGTMDDNPVTTIAVTCRPNA
ncbi:MAG: hypothetical protein V7631_1200 [Massilia sp.]|jgi:hypothetical protein